MKALFVFLLLIVTGCSLPTQETGYDFAGLHLQPTVDWQISESRKSVMTAMEFNRGEKCQMLACPRLDFYSSDFSEWKSWFDDAGTYVALGSCDSLASAYALPARRPSGDIEVDGVKAEYFESVSCFSGIPARYTWLLQRHGDDLDLIIQGTAAAKYGDPIDDGYFPAVEVREMLTTATWE